MERNIDVMGAGSLIALKQYDLFIAIIKDAIHYFPRLTVIICGGGPEKESLLTQVRDHNLQNNISFTGELPHQEVIQLMQRTKIFLHTSRYEGFGAVCAEALYAGVHVVSFVEPMNVKFRHHHTVNSKQEMTDKLTWLLQDNKRDHERILMYPAEEIAKKIMDLFTG